MRVFVLSSGSSGNAILLEANDGARLIIDAGLGPRVLTERLRLLGADLFPRGVSAIVVTHHHGDHFAHAEPLSRALRVPLFMHAGVSARRVRSRREVRAYDTHVPFIAGGFEVRAMHVPHDAPQVALSIESSDGVRFGIATDLGHVPASLGAFLGACDAALVEANYCPVMLEDGPYPRRLKQRIRGGFGHLANEQTADLAARLVGTRLTALYLGHLSRANNTPERALEVVAARCAGLAVAVVPHGISHAVQVTRGKSPSGWAARGMGAIGPAVQLALAFA